MRVVSVLGLDVGSKRIGVAGCDPTGLIASGLETIVRCNLGADLDAIRHWIERRRAQAVVIGLPRNMNGSLGPQAHRIQHFGQQLARVIDVPIDYVDERLSTVQAGRALQSVSATRRKALIDQQAAAIILQQWLDIRRCQHRPTQESLDERHIDTER
ncbi:Holliday junction resolvase RuvX [Gloeobacter violaceus]|uniref:Putative pre-16S rRNA nuclease n=1 Tax=Gloeobacter violaceus (strain ATCC 29082 / PCC 7421) TaxID=251221 RepID=YQGF_GLOVI|nr:Holliday junction resolvase RuvX [Gloeobacter violaceus]Q7NLJ1.1 RecName: Full=Putative pre-16S rRNA nuclease [Gloeobacter violaceus PCC 7421]BAC89073.1 gll1132 [Gloeobacter violaceus PCC 7421]